MWEGEVVGGRCMCGWFGDGRFETWEMLGRI